jgi:hypothetical protein
MTRRHTVAVLNELRSGPHVLGCVLLSVPVLQMVIAVTAIDVTTSPADPLRRGTTIVQQ